MFKVLENGTEPTKGSKYSAAVDLYASEDCVIGAGETAIVPLGVCINEYKLEIAMEDCFFYTDKLQYVNGEESDEQFDIRLAKYKDNFMFNHYLALHPRSSLRAKGLIANVGIIDLDYRDEIKIIIHNPLYDNSFDFKIKKGDKIAQIMLVEHKSYLFGIDTDKERTGGIGSTDKGE